MNAAYSKVETQIDFEHLLKLRLVVARHGEMDSAKWWNTAGLLGRKGALLLSRGFPKTHRFAQAKLVFTVARSRCAEVFDSPGCITLWKLPATLEEQFDARWARWLDERDSWEQFFSEIEQPGSNLLDTMRRHHLIEPKQEDDISRLICAADSRSVPISGIFAPNNDILTILAAGFDRGEVGKPAIPYARREE